MERHRRRRRRRRHRRARDGGRVRRHGVAQNAPRPADRRRSEVPAESARVSASLRRHRQRRRAHGILRHHLRHVHRRLRHPRDAALRRRRRARGVAVSLRHLWRGVADVVRHLHGREHLRGGVLDDEGIRDVQLVVLHRRLVVALDVAARARARGVDRSRGAPARDAGRRRGREAGRGVHGGAHPRGRVAGGEGGVAGGEGGVAGDGELGVGEAEGASRRRGERPRPRPRRRRQRHRRSTPSPVQRDGLGIGDAEARDEPRRRAVHVREDHLASPVDERSDGERQNRRSTEAHRPPPTTVRRGDRGGQDMAPRAGPDERFDSPLVRAPHEPRQSAEGEVQRRRVPD
mmetsp:Transcript_2962/g.9724  ORF Transcript_2962/g.9724 Transcript_2962/m.9724 type:complete len:346 (+) Transcript_2962:1513-2550(+)